MDHLRPKKTTGGMAALGIAPVLEERLGHSSRLLSHILEMYNLSSGRRTVAEIARIVRYEIGAIDPSVVRLAFEAFAKEGLITWEGEQPAVATDALR